MKSKKIVTMILAICLLSTSLCACGKEENNNEIILPTNSTIETTEVVTEETTEDVKEEDVVKENVGLVTGKANVEVVEYNAEVGQNAVVPENVGTCAFSILTDNGDAETTVHNIADTKALEDTFNQYSTIIDKDNFNITYNNDSHEMKYTMTGFTTTYTFSTEIEMYSISSPIFDKNSSYLINQVKYDETTNTMYIFLKVGWPYYQEAHTEADEQLLKDGIEKATGSTLMFFNEIGENIHPESYVIVMPDPNAPISETPEA